MIDIFFFLFYRFFLIPLALLVLKIGKPFLPTKLQKMLEERSTPQRPSFWARPIWIHAASGEIEYAKSVVRELKSRYPEIPILATYFSPSALKLIHGVADIDFILPLPFDHRPKVKAFINYVNPVAVLFARTDVWPELAFQLRQKKIPSLLFSATLSTQSGRAQGVGRFISRFAFDQLTQISCVNEEDLRNFSELGVTTPILVEGDTRFDQAIFRLQNPKALKLELKPQSLQVFVAGSTWPQDEAVLYSTFKSWLASGGEIILAPHEVTETHLQDIEEKLKVLNLKSQRYSSAQQTAEKVILLIDTIGILPEIYNWGTVSFVGGSFKDKVHSVMEPLAAGLPVIVGPYHSNNREALHFQHQFFQGTKTTIVSIAHNSSEASDLLHSLSSAQTATDAKEFIKNLVLKKSGVSAKIADWPPIDETIRKLQPTSPRKT